MGEQKLENIRFLEEGGYLLYTFHPDYPVRSLKDVPLCDHDEAQFQGLYSLVGYYYCPTCESKFEPQDFQQKFVWNA